MAHSNGTLHVDETIAVQPNAIDDVPRLLEEVSSRGKMLAKDEPQARRRLLESARSLVNALETPRETMIRMCWSQVGFLASLTELSLTVMLPRALHMQQLKRASTSVFSRSSPRMKSQERLLRWPTRRVQSQCSSVYAQQRQSVFMSLTQGRPDLEASRSDGRDQRDRP
jgi:hypothetical protein